MSKNKISISNKKAFTMAELLIALAIIGVIVLFIKPTVEKISPDEHELKMKKAFRTTQDVVQKMISSELYYPNNDPDNPGFRDQTAVTLPDGTVASGNSKFCQIFASMLNTVGEVDCSEATPPFDYNVLTIKDGSLGAAYALGGKNFTTTDGFTWTIPTRNNAESTVFGGANSRFIMVDINGTDEYSAESPNCYDYTDAECVSPDQIYINVGYLGGVYLNTNHNNYSTADVIRETDIQ